MQCSNCLEDNPADAQFCGKCGHDLAAPGEFGVAYAPADGSSKIGLWPGLLRRMIGAAKLDVNVYEEVKADLSATKQALWVVAIAAVAGGVGRLGDQGVSGLIVGVIFGLAGWVVWAGITMWIGTTVLRTPETE